VFISEWSDTSISLVVGLPTGIKNGHMLALSPVDDPGPLTFFVQPGVHNSCAVAASDVMQFTVTNPQTGVASNGGYKVPVTASPTGTTPDY
jgi:hypothetical protein